MRAQENLQNLRKWVQSLCGPLQPLRSETKKSSTTAFYPMRTGIKIFCYLVRYRVQQKTVKFVEVVPKTVGSATFCAYRNALSHYNAAQDAVLYGCPKRRFPRPSAVPEPSKHRMRTVDNVITVVLPRKPVSYTHLTLPTIYSV